MKLKFWWRGFQRRDNGWQWRWLVDGSSNLWLRNADDSVPGTLAWLRRYLR